MQPVRRSWATRTSRHCGAGRVASDGDRAGSCVWIGDRQALLVTVAAGRRSAAVRLPAVHSASPPRAWRSRPPLVDQLQQPALRCGAVRPIVTAGHQRGHFLGRQAELEVVKQRAGILRRRLTLERRVQVGDHHVVGLDGLKTARLQPPAIRGLEHQRRRRVANRSVAVAGLALELRRRARRGARLGLIALVGRDHRWAHRSVRRSRRRRLRARRRARLASGSSSSNRRGVLKLASCSARNTRHSLPGHCWRAAITARHARDDALSRGLGFGANGIP